MVSLYKRIGWRGCHPASAVLASQTQPSPEPFYFPPDSSPPKRSYIGSRGLTDVDKSSPPPNAGSGAKAKAENVGTGTQRVSDRRLHGLCDPVLAGSDHIFGSRVDYTSMTETALSRA